MKKLNLREVMFLTVAVCSLLFAYVQREHNSLTLDQELEKKSASTERLSQERRFVNESNRADGNLITKGDLAEGDLVIMTPELARKKMMGATSIKDIYDQAAVYRETIKALCRAGYVTEAWEMILDEPGLNRSSQIAGFFLTAPLKFKDAAEKIGNLGSSEEKKDALKFSLATNLDLFPAILENPNFEKLVGDIIKDDPNAQAEILGSALQIGFDNATDSEKKEEIVESFLDLHSKGLVPDSDLAGMITRNLSKGPSELWDWISGSSMGVDDPSSYEGQMRHGIMKGVITADPPKALSQITSETGDTALKNLYDGFYIWASENPSAANEWHSNQTPNLTQEQKDVTSNAFADLALSRGELEGAESWAEQIEDAEMRDSILQKIKTQESPGR